MLDEAEEAALRVKVIEERMLCTALVTEVKSMLVVRMVPVAVVVTVVDEPVAVMVVVRVEADKTAMMTATRTRMKSLEFMMMMMMMCVVFVWQISNLMYTWVCLF